MNPFDWTGGPFLLLYACLFVAAAVWAWLATRLAEPGGSPTSRPDALGLAWLAGGRAQFTDALVADRLAHGELTMAGDRFLERPGERGVTWSELYARHRPDADTMRARLRRDGLLLMPAPLAALRFRATLPLVLLIGFGAIKLLVGEARERPVGYLMALLLATAVVAVLRWFSIDGRTRAARALVEGERRAQDRLRRAPLQGEIGMAVALFGAGVLAGSAWDDYHRLRTGDGSASGGGDTGGDGGGDGGGGGCGGCGS